MNELAIALNKTLSSTVVLDCLSDYGKRIYVPKGIIVQGAEAKKKADKRFNATVGIATSEPGQAMYLDSTRKSFSDSLDISEIYPYAPMGGVAALRDAWKSEMIKKNPDLASKRFSNPIVTSGLTTAITLASSLFLNPGDALVMPEMYWENYNLIFTERFEAKLVTFPNFNDKGGFNTKAMKKALDSIKEQKITILLNFPNNPTGYSPTRAEANAIVRILTDKAEEGHKVIVITDDAYFGLFYENSIFKQSLFAKLCDAHQNLLAIKTDGATKEELAWGFRTAFITYGSKGLTEVQLGALEQKTLGLVRSSLSSCSTPSQNIILKAMSDKHHDKEKKAALMILKDRYLTLKAELLKHSDSSDLSPLPFNSGYFMSFWTRCNAEDLRQKLLDELATGVICLDEHHIRLAYSSVRQEDLGVLIDNLYKAASLL
ncbi:MAG: aminotransferase class I/II-fold pyridoxal phosphate-dependent enzyme [Sphaerochaetaceae bacterium]|nr:aminotransferase class I/II-fold pyridoxal phosphate-dependent enzyme [Sphaerochaetaceae bacterium]